MATFSRNRLTTTLLSWVAGFVDTAGFLKLNGLFTAHVTGNLVVAGAQLAGLGGEAVWVRLAVIPVFMIAVALTTLFSRKYQLKLSSLLWFEAILLLAFAIVSVGLVPAGRPEPLAMFLAGAAGVLAMGVQNALMREAFGSLAPTTVMTGNLTQFTIDLARLTLIREQEQPRLDALNPQAQEMRQRLRKFGDALLGFVTGAVFGAFFTGRIGLWSLLLPAGAVVSLALITRRSSSSV